MAKLPVITGKQALKALHTAGFAVVKVRGSHYHLRDDKGRNVFVPVHAGEVVAPGTLRNILSAANLSPEEFSKLL